MLFKKNKNNRVQSSEEEKMTIEYLIFKNRVRDGIEAIEAYVDWLEAELADTNKLWANFHRFFYATYLYLLEQVPFLKRTELDYEGNRPPYDLSGECRVRCPFDEDGTYVLKYSEEHPVDVAQIPKEFCAPFDYQQKDGQKELTKQEYIALWFYDICKRNLAEVKELILFYEDPLGFSVKMMQKMQESKNTEGLVLWTLAAAIEQEYKTIDDPVNIDYERYSRFFKYVGI